ncbi:MAG: DUF551 domain-containing protein [Oscillospiraceae bacterium]|nr:DUF551 domain-containing protein [Oscillospiraceae bacterium]
MTDEWISVDEKMPEAAGMPFLVSAVNRYNQRDEFIAYLGYSYELWCTDDVTKMSNPNAGDNTVNPSWKVTDWRPLPRVERTVELVPDSTRPKCERYRCTSCCDLCYFPHSAGLKNPPYKFCPNCGKKVKQSDEP